MAKRINVTVPVDFRVKEGDRTFWISIEPSGGKLPAELNDALINLHPAPGVTFERLQDIAELLRNEIAEFHFQHPIVQ